MHYLYIIYSASHDAYYKGISKLIIMRFTLTSILTYCCLTISSAQFVDNQWIIGRGGGFAEQDSFGLVVLDFTDNKLTIRDEQEIFYDFGGGYSLWNENDSLFLYFNGASIYNRNHEGMENGDNFYLGELIHNATSQTQRSLLLPFPGSNNELFLLTTDIEINSEGMLSGQDMRYSIINILGDDGLGAVTIKNIPVENVDHSCGKLTAVKHANGRDWWIVTQRWSSNEFIRLLITPSGIEHLSNQVVGTPFSSRGGNAVFSPDGNFFTYATTASLMAANDSLHIFTFDRCEGVLRPLVKIPHINENDSFISASFSPDSRYLYAFGPLRIYQFDLLADDIIGSRTLISTSTSFNHRYVNGQLARDGKIYISGGGFSTRYSVINYPDRSGEAVEISELQLPVFSSENPLYPNYRLGPIDGSICDTLGLDNHPRANFRSDQNTSNYLSFYFQDLSYYEPTEWYWTFGDGGMSQDSSPVHNYLEDGIYEVCLTVSNNNSSDTYCQTLEVGVVSVVDDNFSVGLKAFPNPAKDNVSIIINNYFPRYAILSVYNANGLQLAEERMFHGWNNVTVTDLPAGIYSYELWDSGHRLASGKFIKAK